MKLKLAYLLLLPLLILGCRSGEQQTTSDSSPQFKVDGQDFFIKGMNWKYYPIGTNYNYYLWEQSDSFIKKALKDEMSMLKEIGVNTIRQYTDVPPKWITYIHREYGIYTVLNHSFGRYGLTLNGKWVTPTNYADSATQDLILSEIQDLVNSYNNTPGVLMYLLGNENNYGLFWEGAETEDIPEETEEGVTRAKALYKLFNKGVEIIKRTDMKTPVAICNGDLKYIDLLVKECPTIDVLGINIYRGLSFDSFFKDLKAVSNKPVMLTEFGADALNNVTKTEDPVAQAKYIKSNWKEIYDNAPGLTQSGNCIGGFTFQFSDGWWKTGQTINLDKHDSSASWVNGGYLEDYVPGENNMNEEWFGVCSKGHNRDDGTYPLYPRAAYYVLKAAHNQDPYQLLKAGISIDKYFNKIEVTDAALEAQKHSKHKN